METALLVGDGVQDVLTPIAQLAVMVTHVLDNLVRDLGQERLIETELAPKARGPAQDHAQHVIPADVAGQRAVGNQEGRRATVIGNHAIGHDVLIDLGIGMSGQFLRAANQRHE